MPYEQQHAAAVWRRLRQPIRVTAAALGVSGTMLHRELRGQRLMPVERLRALQKLLSL